MLRDMSSLRIFRRNSQKHVPQEQIENATSENPTDSNSMSTAMVGSARAPLSPISEPSQKTAGVATENSSDSRKCDGTPTKPKGKGHVRRDDSEIPPFTSPLKHGLVPPAPTGNANNRNRFGWPQRHDSSFREINVANGRRSPIIRDNHSESPGDMSFTPRSLTYAAGNEASNGNGHALQSNRGFVVGNGGSNQATPRPIKTSRASSTQSECSSTSSTPTKSVTRQVNSGASAGTALNGFRFPAAQNSGARSGHTSKYICVASATPTVVNTIEVPHFELKEDPAFWMDHNVQVFVRIRPLNSSEVASQGYNRCLKQESAQTLTFLGPPETRFTFDHVACETITQEMLFKVAGLPMVENCMSGYNSCMFAYGQTGSGKTHTMLGDIDELDQRPSINRGMTPRIFEYLFARIRAEEESHTQERLKYACKCSFLEIYNEQISDLLEPSSINLQLREDVRKGVYVENLTEVEVRSVQDIVRLLLLGAANRKVAATNMNRESSRSHSVFTCVIESHWEKDSMTNIRYGRLNLVDLAGSERQKSSGAEGERLKEAANINKSLSTLGLVIMILVDVAQGKQRHIPYRDSRLTFLLQDSLGGNSKTTIIANISPSLCSANETLSTLKFAQRAKFIQNNAIINEDASGDVMALRLQIQQLKEELSFFKRQNVSRSLSFRSTIFSEMKPSNGEGNMTFVPSNNLKFPESSLDLLPSSNALCSPKISNKKLKSLEATLAGALRREQVAENTTKRLEAEIEQLNRLVRQREEDTQCSKMMLRFREDKIRRLESVTDGLLSSDAYLLEEKNALAEELQLIRGRLDRNPELTRFAMENIRLLEQLRKYQDFYEGGEREVLVGEVSDLREQLLEVLEGKFEQEKNPCALSTPQDIVAPEFACIVRENQMLKSEMDNTRKEIEDCRNHLSACLESNEKMSREIDELHVQLEELKATGCLQQKELKTLRSQYSGGDTVEREIGHEQSITYLKSQLQMEMELRAKTDLQGKAQREQELEMRHSEEIMQLQLEIESIETVVEEERSYRKEAEERVLQLHQELEAATEKSLQFSKDLEAALAKVNEGKSVIEALESQQLFSINEMENLQVQNREMLELLNKKEEERNLLEMNNKLLHEQLIGYKEVSMVEKQRKDQCSEGTYDEHSLLQIKIERMENALEKARRLNMKLQYEQASHTSHEEEKDQVRRQAESETAEVIICLQEELVALREQVDSTTSRESEASECLTNLKGEVEDLQNKLKCLTEENERLVSMMVRKDDEIKKLKDEWEKAATDLADCLAEGDQALEDASGQMENIMDLFPERRLKIDQGVEKVVAILAEKERVIDILQKQLQHAHKLARETEGKIRSLKDATVAITEVQRQENDEISKEASKMRSELSHKLSIVQSLENKVANYQIGIHEAEKRASAAFIMVKKLTEMNEAQTELANCAAIELEEAFEVRCCQNDNLVRDLQTEVIEARLQIESLKQQIQRSEDERHELKRSIANELDKLKVAEKNVQVKETNIQMMEDQVEKSWHKAFEMESYLYLYFGAIERELSANKVDLITHFKNLQRQVQDQFEEMHTLKDDLIYHFGYQTEVMQQSIKDSRDKENTMVLAFADAVLCAKTMQHRNAKIMCQLSESEASLRSARDKLKMMQIELKEKDQKVQELTAALQALEVVKSNVEIEKKQLMLLADEASSRCSTKEQELHDVQKELACILAELKELEGKAHSVNSRVEEPLKQIKDLQEERSKFLADLDAQKTKLDNEGEGPHYGTKDVEGQVMTKQVAAIEELAVMQCNIGITQTKMVDSTLTDVPMLEKSGWEYEKEILLEDVANASVMVSDKEKDLSSLHNSLAEVREKLKVTEDRLGALVALINVFASSEEHLRNERNGLSSKLELLRTVLLEKEKQVEILRNQQVGQISEVVPKSTVIQDFDNVTFISERDRMKFETLRTSIYEKDQTILSVRKEMEAALASLKEAELEMNKTFDEKEELHKSVEAGRQNIESLTNEVKNLQEEINHKGRKIELLQSEMVKMLDSIEQRMKEAEAGWWKEKEILSLELNDAKLIASEKSSEAVSVLRKFEESQETMREADLMLNALLRANENAKCDTERWKNVEEELVSERSSLINEVERAKIAFAEKEQQVVLMHEQIQRDSEVIRDLISVVEESVINCMRGVQEEFKTINTEIGSLKVDLQSALDSPRTWFEEMWCMVAERNNTMSLLHASRVQELMGKLQTLYTHVGFLNKKLTVSNESLSQLEENNMHLHEEVDKRKNLGARLEANIVDKEIQIERLLGQLSEMESKISDLEVQEDLITKWSTAKDFELTGLISDVEQMCTDLEATSSELKKMEREKEEFSLQLEQSRDKIACLEQDQESIHLEIDSLNMQLNESNRRICQLEKCNMDLNNEVKEYESALAELHEDLKYGPERAFQSVEVRENLAGPLQLLKMEISNLKVKEKILKKEMMDKESQVEVLRQEVGAHAKVQSHLEEMIQLVEDVRREKQVLSLELEKSLKMNNKLEDEKASFKLEEARLKERLNALNFEIDHNSESLAQFQKLSAAADEELKKRDEVIEVLHKKLEEASVNSSCMEQERKELQDKGCMLDNSLAALQSDFDLKNKDLIELQISYSKVLEELELKHQEIEVLICKLNFEIDHNSESLAQFQKLSAAADEELKKRDEVIEVLHKKLEEASVNSSRIEQERTELQDKGCMLDNSLAALQSDFDLKNKDLIELQLSYSKVLEELELKHQEIEVLINKLNASEMDNMELRNSICKEIETKGNLCSELQKNNHIAAEIKMECSKSAELLKAREAEVMMLTQSKEYISNKLQRVENENRELNEMIKMQNKKFQEFTKQVKTLAEQLSNNSHSSLQVAEKLEVRLNSLQESFLSAVSMEKADEMQVVYIENILQYISVLEEKTCAFLAQTELLEMNSKDLMFQKASLCIELERREEILNGLQFDLSLLQESASKAKDQRDEVQETAAALNDELRRVMSLNDHVEVKLMEKENELNSLNTELEELKETVASVSHENSQLAIDVEDLLTRKNSVEEELEEKQKVIDGLEEELLEMSSLVNQQMIHSIESMKREIKNVTRERDRLQAEVLVLNEQLEMAQAFADEREAIAVEARQVAEARKTYAEEKEEETKLLERSVEELERTVNALESQVDIVKLEAERQRLMKEDLELELQSLRHQMITMQNTHTSVNSQTSTDSLESVTEDQRPIMEFELHEASKRIQILEKETEEKEIEINKCKEHIAELIMNAETQANEYQQKYKALEAMANQVKAEQLNPNAITSSTNKSGEKTVVRSRGSGSPFKCIGLGLAQQMNSERDEELHASRRRIEELENFLAARQKEIFMLNSRLAAAESMTHDVIRDLLGVKLDMTNYASVLDNQQVQKIAEKARRQNEESQEKEQEMLKLKHQLNDLIEERESWLDEINRRQAEMVAARVAAEKLRQRDQFLTTENEMLKTDTANQKKRLVELEDEVKKLSGQQNLQQRIHHHAKIKEENNALRVQYEELATKLRRTEVLLARVSDELAQYRAAEGRSPYISVDEEQRLRNKLQETEEERVQMAQKLLGLCNGILQAAGIIRPPRDIDPSLAVETLQQLKERLECTERELRELKLKTKIASEKMKLSELRQLSNSPLSVKANDKSFTSVQQSCSSPANSNLR